MVRKDVIGVVRELNRRGVTCASIEYRLADGGKDTVMESVADCLDAVSFLIVRGAGHGLQGEAIQPEAEEICRRAVEFFLEHLTSK